MLATALSAATQALALDRQEVRIGGNVDQKVRVGTAVNVGVGVGVDIKQSIGSIHGGVRIKGNVKRDVRVKNAVNVGIGLGFFTIGGSCQEIGSMGDDC